MGQKVLSFLNCLNFTFVLGICVEVLILQVQKLGNKTLIIYLDRELRCMWAVSHVLKLIYGELKPLDFNPIHEERTVRPLDRVLGTVAVLRGKY